MISNGAGAAFEITEGVGAAPHTGRSAAADFNSNDPDPVTSEPTANNNLEDVANSNTENTVLKTDHSRPQPKTKEVKTEGTMNENVHLSWPCSMMCVCLFFLPIVF